MHISVAPLPPHSMSADRYCGSLGCPGRRKIYETLDPFIDVLPEPRAQVRATTHLALAVLYLVPILWLRLTQNTREYVRCDWLISGVTGTWSDLSCTCSDRLYTVTNTINVPRSATVYGGLLHAMVGMAMVLLNPVVVIFLLSDGHHPA